MSWNLPGAPWLIGHKSMLSINQPKKLTIGGHDYVLWKNKKGEVSALENICPHQRAKLSQGWICSKTNTIACPYHALEFDSAGRAILPREKISKPIAKPLQLHCQGDWIWTYLNEKPKMPIPNIFLKLEKEFHLAGISGDVTINAPFLDVLEINNDYNHAKGAHRNLFKIKDIQIKDVVEVDKYTTEISFHHIREDNSLQDYLKNPILLTYPKVVKAFLQHYFPCLAIFYADTPLGRVCDAFAIYPETENTTHIFIAVFGNKSLGILNFITDRQLLSTINKLNEQDVEVLENLYPRFEPQIRLPNEEPLNWARNLYQTWSA
jgi:phenylpropionate dioxygenase-like ring-hydroxylating dioxygenase large terminal subunit